MARNRQRFHCDLYVRDQEHRRLVIGVAADRTHLDVLMEVQPNRQVVHRIERSVRNVKNQ